VRIEKALATLAAIWGITPAEVAARLGIEGDFTHLQAAELGARFRKALSKADNRRKSGRKYHQSRVAQVVDESAAVVEKHFTALRRELMKFVRSRAAADAEDIVQETLYALCTMEGLDGYEGAIKRAKVIARRLIAYKHYRLANDPATVTPHEDFYVLEEIHGWVDEPTAETDFAPTTDLEEAFRRVALELVRFVGVKQAAVAVGMREKTFRPAIGL